MSGVVAVFARNGSPVDAAEVDDLLQRQAHRGPDGLRVWCDGPVGFGYAALDPSGAGASIEPLVTDGGRLAIVGDLRIDNRRELIGTLECLDRRRRVASDAEVVLEAYRRWGIDAPCHLEGAFAFAIWDALEQRVFCARDHLGVKPLTYHLSEKLFVCASEAEAVPCARGVSRRINEARIADFLVSELEGVDHTCTFFEGVARLPPAHVLVVDRNSHQLRRYWQPGVGTELLLGSDEDYADAFSETFRQAVGSCLVNVAAPGLLLSGGIDSSAVAAFGRSLAEDGVAAALTIFSAIDEENDPSPETANILATIEDLGVGARTLSPAMVAGMNPQVRRSLLDCGEPFDSYMVVDQLFFSLAAGAGTRVVLDGVDGDVVCSNPVPTTHLLRQGNLFRAWREAAAHRRLFPVAVDPLRAISVGAVRAWSPRGFRRLARRVLSRRRRVADAIGESLIDRGFAERVGVADRLEQLWSHSRDHSHGNPRDAHARAVTHPYVAVALERYDRVAARCGIDIQHPFYDLRLVKFCLSLPWDLKVRDGWTKFVLRLATRGMVRDGIRWRHDYGDVLWRPTSRVITEEREYLGGFLRAHENDLGPYIDRSKLRGLQTALGGNLTDREEVSVWEASSLARWLALNR